MLETTEITSNSIKALIYTVRNKQVMLDSDLAILYGIETKVFNQAVKRNIERFPEKFRFQLTKEEDINLRSQIVTSSSDNYGGRRYLPYVFTEQGIAMLSAVLKSSTAIDISIRIMDAFVSMRHFIAENELLFERISSIELKQLEYQKSTNSKFDEVFSRINKQDEYTQKVFFEGQIYDAFSLLIDIIKKANMNITVIDGYVDTDTLNILAKKKSNVDICIYTFPKTRLTLSDIKKFNSQYPNLTVHHTQSFHDRFIILDNKEVYHIGASLKDAGKKCFGITKMEDPLILKGLLEEL